MSASASVSWDNAAQEFGQKVDLTVRLREILRNYPEGLSILKEIIQNSDDAGARTVRFCTAEPRRSKGTNNDNNLDVLSNAMKGPSLLAYNSAKFTKTDFQSIQQIGESLKKDAKNKGTKTGRFGVGFNSTYHLTDLPMFVSGTKVVIFDPQAKYVPGINPANPGKMIDFSSSKGKNENGRNLVKSLPFVFDPLKVFGCDLGLGLKGDEDFNGTSFRFALRTQEQAKISRLSRQSHSIDKMRDLLKQLASVAPEMLIFLKNVERIEIYDWKSTEEEPTLLHETYITTQKNNHGTLRKKRAFMLNYDPSSNKPTAVDYILDIQSNSTGVQDEGEGKKNKTSSSSSRWIVCNQLGGGHASVMANDSELSHMKLVPYGGVAARIPCDDSTSSSPFITDGKAYCFLPLPINTELPIHINGYFELSSNRRDVWSYGSDMAGDGKARAKWNESIVQDIAAPSYIRLVQKAIRANLVTPENYESLFPLKTMKNNGDDIWGTLCREFYKGIRDLPVLFSECRAVTADDENGQWVKPSKSILPHNEKDTKLMEILALEKLPLVLPNNKELKENLLKYKTCTITASPANIRKYYSRRKPKNKTNNDTGGSLEHKEKKIEYAQYLLSYCLQDLSKNEYNTELSGCQFIPLANGTLGTFCVLPKYDENALKQLQKMGFAEKLSCIHALRTTGNNVDEAMESLLQKNSSPNDNNDNSVPIIGLDPYLICEKDTASLLTPNASNTIVNLDQIKDLNLKLFFRSREAHQQLNILSITPDMLADVVARSIPVNWRGNESAPWDPSQKKTTKSNNNNGDDECERSWPDVQWFVDLWRFILCSSSSNTDFDIIHTIAERYCIVPTQQGIVCTLSPGASVIDFSSNQNNGGIHNQNKHEEENITKILVSLGVRIFHHEVFPKDLVIPKALWSYVFEPTIDGVIKVMDTALRRESSMGRNLLDQAGNETKSELFTYFCNRSQREKISKHCKVMLRNYPIFESYSCDYDRASSLSSSAHGETKEETRIPQSFVPMKAGKVWYILEDATKEDKAFMTTSDFLACKNKREVDFLVQLGAKKMSRSNFYKQLVLPSIAAGSSVCNEEEIKNAMIAKILLNISSLEIENPGFPEFLSKSKCIPSAVTKTLNAPCDLYDPEVSQLVNLMSDDSFPDEYFTEQPDLLFSLRKLGLQTKLSWDVILDCARSIEKEGTRIISQQQDVDNSENGEIEEEDSKRSSAKARGKELLLFLDMYKETYFPEMKKKSHESRSSVLFRKVNNALFASDSSEQKKREKQLQMNRVQQLLSIKWMPVHTKPPSPFLPWPQHCNPVECPVNTITSDKMWIASYSKRLVDKGDVHVSIELQRMFGWLNDVPIEEVALQLKMMSKSFEMMSHDINNKDEGLEKNVTLKNTLCQKITSEVGRIYHILDKVAGRRSEAEYECGVIKSMLYGEKWLWMGNAFVESEHVAFTNNVNASPYLFTVPQSVACFKDLLAIFNVRNTFGSSDYCSVLSRMAEEQKQKPKVVKDNHNNTHSWSDEKTDLAVNLVQKISDDDRLRLKDLEIYAPTTTGEMVLANTMVYDDAPWLSKDLGGKKDLIYVHNKLSAAVCDKIGVKSVRKILLQSNQTDMIKFGDSVVHEAFGQSEALTRRLKNIIELYPEGPQQLSELIQNADDAQATVVKFVVSKKQHKKSSLLGQNMTEWQGAGLYCYNDATFTASDFENLSKIGQASKLQKLVTTGRFGLGFNSVFHWTDVPSLVSGDYLVMFDPHTKYVPGATDAARGIKIRFAGSDLVETFPDQMSPYMKLGCDMKRRLNGTMFRFPFRNDKTSAESEISKKQFGEDEIGELLEGFKKVASKVILFLRHVKKVEVYVEEDDEEGPKLLYSANVASRSKIVTRENAGYLSSSLAASLRLQPSNDWNAIANFVAGSGFKMSKEAFYSKLMNTSENQLPRTKHIVTTSFVEFNDDKTDDKNPTMNVSDQYLICQALGGGECRAMACQPENFDLKFLPWAGIAVHISRNGQDPPKNQRGNAFCFLPLPAETGFPVHINGYFELSANRRDIWIGDDMSGSGKKRSEWNRLLLKDVISPLYIEVLLTCRSLLSPGKQYYSLWPVNVSSIWEVVKTEVYKLAFADQYKLLVYTMLDGGKWCSLGNAVFLEDDDVEENKLIPASAQQTMISNKKLLLNILLEEKISVVPISSKVISCMKDEKCNIMTVSASMVRKWFKRPINHPSLCDQKSIIFLLRYCCDDDLIENNLYEMLHGLPLLPLLNGLNGTIQPPSSAAGGETFYVQNSQIEKDLLTSASFCIIDIDTNDPRVNNLLKSKEFHSSTNVEFIQKHSFVNLLSHAYPVEWTGLPEIQWSTTSTNTDDNISLVDSPENPFWIKKLWDYIAENYEYGEHTKNLSYLENELQIVPTVVGKDMKTLQMLSRNMAVVNIEESDKKNGLSEILWSVGMRTLDTSVFTRDNMDKINRLLTNYIQPFTVKGIIKALTYSTPSDLSIEERNKRMAARFQYLSSTEKNKFRNFLVGACDDFDLTKEEIITLRSLPIFQVYALGKKEEFSQLSNNSLEPYYFLPPSCAQTKHLDHRFVRATSRKAVDFFELLGLKIMDPVYYYGNYLCDALSQNIIPEESRNSAVIKLLQDLPSLSEEKDGKNLINLISNVACVPNSQGQLVRPQNLYDPNETGLIELVDDSMLPALELRHAGLLQSLRTLGMKTKLSSDGIIESARLIEFEAKKLSAKCRDSSNSNSETIDTCIKKIRKRALSLLNFLDNDNTVEAFLSESDVSTFNSNVRNDEIEVSLMDDSVPSYTLMNKLNSICWLPVEKSSLVNGGEIDRLNPPRRKHELSRVGISSPEKTRPKTDEWICSKSCDILSGSTKSERLMELFQWNIPPKVNDVAAQLVALSKLFEDHSESQQQPHFRQHFAKVTSQIYEILDSQVDSVPDEEKEELMSLFQEHAWIWVGEKFVSTAQVAFNAPENAKPFLYTVPTAMECFDKLLEACGVRESFSGNDFVKLLSSLANQLDGNTLNSRQLDLAIFVARHLSRVPQEEFDMLDKSQIYLPSKENTMHKAKDMTFDDAPWLSAITKRTSHVFVHPAVGVEIARILGSKSLRDVLSASQNGMVKIPCPKSEAIKQLLALKTNIDKTEMGRVILNLIELGEMKCAKQVSITIDHRSHGSMSLLHPGLAAAQGPSLIVCLHGVVTEVDEIVRLSSPAKYYSSCTSGGGGSGGKGYPRFGCSVCSAFVLSDLIQVLSGKSLMIFDPSGQYFLDDQMNDHVDQAQDEETSENKRRKKGKANARNYDVGLYKQFPDQFDPFFSLPFVKQMDSESMTSNTIFRIPFRTKDSPPSTLCDKTYEKEDLEYLVTELVEILPQTLLFTYNLQSVCLDIWQREESISKTYLSCSVRSSPITRRSHLEELRENNSWKKDKSKISKFFKSAWVPVRSCHTMQIYCKTKGGIDTTDTYFIMSILAPPRLREMACTETLASLNLIPSVSIAAHINRSPVDSNLKNVTTEYKAAEGKIFVGLPTGIKTGLGFHINAPLFLHEWKGDVLLQKEDDNDLKAAFPSVRNVTTIDKNNVRKTLNLALYVWNRRVISCAVSLIPEMMKEIKNSIHLYHLRDQKLLYRFWPFYERIKPRFKDIVDMDSSIYKQLASPDMDIYLTESDGFKSIGQGCFASPDYKLEGNASDFFLSRTAVFKTPKLVVEDLKRFGIDGLQQLTPSLARNLLKVGGHHIRELNGRPRLTLEILQYCLADLMNVTDFSPSSQAASICRKELLGLYIIPLADGTIGKISSGIIVATATQQSMLPTIKDKFLWSHAVTALEKLLCNSDFISILSFRRFGAKVLSENISAVLPRSWLDKNFVDWKPWQNADAEFDSQQQQQQHVKHPTQLWLYQFWKEVDIWDHDSVQLFRRWPLIPTKTGELACCGNARFILYISSTSMNDTLRNSLSEEFSAHCKNHESNEKRELMNLAAERRLQKRNDSSTVPLPSDIDSSGLALEEFWDMGKPDILDSLEQELSNLESNLLDDVVADTTNGDIEESEIDDVEENATSHGNSIEEVDESAVPEVSSNHNVLSYDPRSSSLYSLYEILLQIKCPLLEPSFFTDEDMTKILPADRLGVTRAIMKTLTQCSNYWDSSSTTRLQWSSLEKNQFDELLMHLYTHEGARLSLMISDLTQMKELPIFETFNESHISISDRDQNFTLDPSVDLDGLKAYLPMSLQRKLLLDKPQFMDLYEDLNIRVLDEASILMQFVLKEFESISFHQKEVVTKTILSKWSTFKQTTGFVDVLKEIPFVKRKEYVGDREKIVFVKPRELYDPSNELLNLIFDQDRSWFPCDEFEESSDILKELGLQSTVDKKTFLKCALAVEKEQSVTKALKLFEYFNEHFGEFFDNNRSEFIQTLAGICCVPSALDGESLSLCRFQDAAAPKDKHLVFKVMPIIHESAVPPQVMFSALGIVSPPPISVVLKHLRFLLEDESSLDHWSYKHGSIETVFSELFSFLQDYYDDLSPRIKESLQERPIVPIGTTLVKANRLFFRLVKDLSPFFYEVPRAFGAYDVLLRNLGVRDTPRTEDYEYSLLELKKEIGNSRLNANELKSVVEVVSLAADDQNHKSSDTICAPDMDGKLVSVRNLLQNDQPWLVNSYRLDRKKIHLCHPKLNKDLLNKLQIPAMSQHVREVLDDRFILKIVPQDLNEKAKSIRSNICCEEFVSTVSVLAPETTRQKVEDIKRLNLIQVKEIKTRFLLERNNGSSSFDITNQDRASSALCFIDKDRMQILVSELPTGVSLELAVACAICDNYSISRQHLGGLAALLSSPISHFSEVKLRMGLYGDDFHDELLRGEPGNPLVATDKEVASIKPLKIYKKGEIIAVPSSLINDQNHDLVYGIVTEFRAGSPVSRLGVSLGKEELSYLTTQVYSLDRSKGSETTNNKNTSTRAEEIDTISSVDSELFFREDVVEASIVEDIDNSKDMNLLKPVTKTEVLTAVQDLLKSANLSLNDNAQNMLDSNLSLQEALKKKDTEIQVIQKKNNDIMEKALRSVDSFLCPITRDPMMDPVICCDGHTYERAAIEMWLRNNSRSPKTNQPLSSRQLIPNHALRSSIEAMSALRDSVDGYSL